MRTVDVIIPTYRPERSFAELLRRLEAQTHPPGHILVLNTEEVLWQPELAAERKTVEIFHIPKAEFDHGATRDMGAGLSGAEILLFMTQDALPSDTKLIENLVAAFDEPQVKAAYARQIPHKNCRIVEGYARTFNYPEKPSVRRQKDLNKFGIKTYFCSNVCAAYDHAVYKELGGFPSPCIFNEDMIYCARLLRRGFAVSYVPQAKVIHSHNYTNWQQFRRNFDNGVSQAMHPEIFRDIPVTKEGKKLVLRTRNYLKESDRSDLIFGLYVQSAFKYAGFRLGKWYQHLPKGLVRRCSMNRGFWNYRNPDEED